jgi:hypothetical protein
MAGKLKSGLMLAGLLAGSLALGTGCTRAEAEARPQDLLQQQQQQEEGTQDQSGTGNTDPRQQEEGTTEDDVLNEPGTGGSVDPGTTDEDIMDEPGTGGAGGTGQDTVRDEDEGVLEPGVNDEGLDHNEGQVDEDTVSPPGTRPQPED